MASMLSLFLWGAGQFYNGQLLKGFVFILTNVLVIPWIISVYDAYTTAQRIDYGDIRVVRTYPWYVATIISIFIGGLSVYFLVVSVKSLLNSFNTRPQDSYHHMARSNLSMLSLASELFFQTHGRYPLSVDELLRATPPYISHNMCGQEELYFKYACQFEAKGYAFTAQPLEPMKKFEKMSITTKGIWQ